MISALANQWGLMGHEVSLFVPADWSQQNWQSQNHGPVNVCKKRLRLPELPHRSLRGFIGGLLEFPQTLMELRRYCREESVDLIHLHTPRDYQLYFRFLRWFGGPPMVLTFHGTDTLHYVGGTHPGIGLIHFIVRGMDALTAVSRHYSKQLEESPYGRKPVHYLPNGIDLPPETPQTNRKREQNPEWDWLPEKFFIIVGWIEPPKGCEVAVRAWGEIIKKEPDCHLLFIGDQPFRKPGKAFFPGFMEKIQQLVTQLDCQEQIHFVGTQPPPQVKELMERAYGLIFPSHQEGLPYVLLEAGAAALPVVCNDIPAFSEIIQNGENGLLAADGDEESWSKAILTLITNPKQAQKMGQTLLQTIKNKYSAPIMAKNYLDLFSSLIEEKKR
jgi:glycosyltransferase involved in cell wall biosynthesis